MKSGFENTFYNFKYWFTDKEHPNSKLRLHYFIRDSIKFLIVFIFMIIIYNNVDIINKIQLYFIKIGSLILLSLLIYLIFISYKLIKNLKYGYRGLNNGIKYSLMILILVIVILLYLNQKSFIDTSMKIYDKIYFSRAIPFDFSSGTIKGNESLSTSNFNNFISKFNNFIPQPWGNLIIIAIVIIILIVLLSKFIFHGNIPQWIWIILIIIGIVTAFQFPIPYDKVKISDSNLYCDDNNVMKMQQNFMGLGGLSLGLQCLDYKSSRCRPTCMNKVPYCQCEAVLTDLVFHQKGDWIYEK